MGVLENLKPQKVFEYFEDITQIPRGSGNVRKISDYLAGFAKGNGLKYRQDEMGNVIIWKDGTAGYEQSKPVILQGHMDMVAVKTEDCAKDMEKDPLTLEVNGDWLSARQTSLGGDDGIAVAYMLALLSSDDIPHPPIEAVFTVNEEVGMVGAGFMDVSDLKGRLFINVDSEDEGIFTVSCAGGTTAECILPVRREDATSKVLEIRLTGCSGGHSGIEIDRGRANANCQMGRILLSVYREIGMKLISVNGGEKDNAIAKSCTARISVLPEVSEKTKALIGSVYEEIREEFRFTDPQMNVTVSEAGDEADRAFTGTATLATIILLVNTPSGIQRMNPEVQGMVQTSLNLGILRTEENQVKFSFAVRSSKESEREYLISQLRALTEIFGGTVKCSGSYPGWEYRSDSKLRDTAMRAYELLYGEKPVVEGVHAGLECGIFASKLEGLDAISFGPDMRNVHTTDEILSISSTERTWKLLLKILEMLR